LNPRTGQSEIPPFTIQADFDLTWLRKPEKWGFIGRLDLHQILNPETFSQGPWMDRFHDLALAVPLLTEVSAIEVAGGLRPTQKELSSWRLAITDAYGSRYNCDLAINSSHWPWSVTASVGSFVVAYEDLASLFEARGLPPARGDIDIRSIRGSGRPGDWSSWILDIDAKASLDGLTLPQTGHRLSGLQADLKTRGSGKNWTGKLSLTAQKVEGAPLKGSLTGLSLNGLDFAISANGIDLKGPYSVREILGGSWTGTVDYSNKGDYHLTGKSGQVNLSPFQSSLSGSCEAVFDLKGNLVDSSDPKLNLDLSSRNFRWDKYDLSARPLNVQLAGTIEGGRRPRWSSSEVRWGTVLHLGMKNCVLNEDLLRIETASLSGDLGVLQELIPGIKISSSVQKWINPGNWTIDGGIVITLRPVFSLSIEKGTMDTGRGIKGPIEFTYNADTSLWRFRSPTLYFDLAKLLQEYQVKPVQAEGTVTVNLSLEGKIPARDQTGNWLQSGTIQGKLESSTGRIRSPFLQPAAQTPWFSWKDLGGPFEVRISSTSRRLTGSLSARQWIFFTIPSQYNSNYQKTLETSATLSLTVTETPGEPYQLQELKISLGDSNPIRILAYGTITKNPVGWTPDLKVKGEADGAGVTPVFRGIQLGGTGVFIGGIKGNKSGNWILDGNLTCSGLRFEQVASPVILRSVRGQFYLRDVYLDEILSRDRWVKRKHVFPSSPDQTDSLDKAFRQSASTRANLQIEAARVGSTLYENLTVRTILIGETLYLNTIEGFFPEGDYPFRATGFVFLIPGRGAGWRLRGETERVPLSLGVPGLFDKMRFEEDLVDVTFYLTRTPPGEKVQTRYLSLGFPIGRLKGIPAVGGLLFGWTPDSLNSTDLVVQKVGEGDWQLLNPFQLPEATAIPKFILMDLPKGVFDRFQRGGKGLLQGVGEGLEDFMGMGE